MSHHDKPSPLVERAIQRLRDNIARREATEDVEALKTVLLELDRLRSSARSATRRTDGDIFRCRKCGCLWRKLQDGKIQAWQLADAEQRPKECCDNSEEFMTTLEPVGSAPCVAVASEWRKLSANYHYEALRVMWGAPFDKDRFQAMHLRYLELARSTQTDERPGE